MIAQTNKSHIGKTFLTDSGWYKLESEHKNDLRTGLTTYFNNNHIKNTIRTRNNIHNNNCLK